MPDLLFIYGTLHPDRAPFEIAPIARRLIPLGPATIRGTLLDLGAYPGVLLGSDSEVAGELFALPEGEEAALWSRLDAFEDFRSDNPSASLFVRQQTLALRSDGSQVHCFIYTYNARAERLF